MAGGRLWTPQESSRLLALRLAYPDWSWEQLTAEYNNGIPPDRIRARYAVILKCRLLQQQQSSSLATEPSNLDTVEETEEGEETKVQSQSFAALKSAQFQLRSADRASGASPMQGANSGHEDPANCHEGLEKASSSISSSPTGSGSRLLEDTQALSDDDWILDWVADEPQSYETAMDQEELESDALREAYDDFEFGL